MLERGISLFRIVETARTLEGGLGVDVALEIAHLLASVMRGSSSAPPPGLERVWFDESGKVWVLVPGESLSVESTVHVLRALLEHGAASGAAGDQISEDTVRMSFAECLAAARPDVPPRVVHLVATSLPGLGGERPGRDREVREVLAAERRPGGRERLRRLVAAARLSTRSVPSLYPVVQPSAPAPPLEVSLARPPRRLLPALASVLVLVLVLVVAVGIPRAFPGALASGGGEAAPRVRAENARETTPLAPRSVVKATCAGPLVVREPAGVRVWLDGAFLAEAPLVRTVPCGSHWVQVGSQGAPREVFVVPPP